jgi:hypothetical protein
VSFIVDLLGLKDGVRPVPLFQAKDVPSGGGQSQGSEIEQNGRVLTPSAFRARGRVAIWLPRPRAVWKFSSLGF